MKTVIKFAFLLFIIAFTCCKKPDSGTSITGISSTSIKYGGILTISGRNFDTSEGAYKIYITDSIKGYTLTPLSVSREQIKVEIFNQQDSTALLEFSTFYAGIKIGTKVHMIDQKINLVSSWIKALNFPGGARYKTAAFSLGGNIYTGAGYGSEGVYKDFWKYSPDSDTWTKLTDFPGVSRVYPRSFSNSTNGYVGAGYSTDNSDRIQLYDYYKYNPADNTWSAIPNYPDNVLSFYIGYTVTVNGRPFISLSNQVLSMRELVNDNWSSVPTVSDMIDCPASGVFSIGKNYYVVLGNRVNNTVSNAVWEFNSETSVWTKKANFPGAARYAPAFFSIDNYGYYGCGMATSSSQFKDMWRYEAAKDKWIRIEDFPGGIRSHLVSTSDGKSGFVGLGIIKYPVTYCNDFWKYSPL